MWWDGCKGTGLMLRCCSHRPGVTKSRKSVLVYILADCNTFIMPFVCLVSLRLFVLIYCLLQAEKNGPQRNIWQHFSLRRKRRSCSVTSIKIFFLGENYPQAIIFLPPLSWQTSGYAPGLSVAFSQCPRGNPENKVWKKTTHNALGN